MKHTWTWALGAIVFMAVFVMVFLWKSGDSVSQTTLASSSQRLNEIGYVGAQLMKCVDENICPEDYDPQSALGLMPFVKLAEDETFQELSLYTKSSPSLGALLEAVNECSNYCSCAVWERFLESEHGADFKMDLSQGMDDACPLWRDLPANSNLNFHGTLKYIEALQN